MPFEKGKGGLKSPRMCAERSAGTCGTQANMLFLGLP